MTVDTAFNSSELAWVEQHCTCGSPDPLHSHTSRCAEILHMTRRTRSTEPMEVGNIFDELKKQIEYTKTLTRGVPREFAGAPGSVSQFCRRVRTALGRGSAPSTPSEVAMFRIFGIPIVEDEDVPEGEIRIRYESGREEVIYLD